jgi:hypothetical protein
MNRDDAMLDEALRQCSPGKLDPRLFATLHKALESVSAPVSEADAEFETWLGTKTPASVSGGLMDRLEAIAVPTSNVVPMAPRDRVISFRRYAVAAAVALIGAATALLAPIDRDAPAMMTSEGTESRIIPLEEARQFVPASYARGLSEARDEGVVWRNNAPHRVLRIVYTDVITLTNDSGETVEVEQPCIEYIVVPEKID